MTRRHREPATYRAATDLYAGDLLPHGRYEAWAEDRREGLRTTSLDLLSGIGKLYARGVQAKQRFLLTDRKVER